MPKQKPRTSFATFAASDPGGPGGRRCVSCQEPFRSAIRAALEQVADGTVPSHQFTSEEWGRAFAMLWRLFLHD